MENSRFWKFREQLAGAGFDLRPLWEAKRDTRNRYNDTFGYSVIQTGDKRAATLTLIIVDYGERDGFGCYIEGGGNSIDSTVAAIVGESGK